MKIRPLIILLTSSLLGLAEEDFPVLSLQREKWEEARSSAQAKIDKSYLNRLEELKKDSVKKGDLDAARAFDKEIKGEAKGAEEEPASLTKMRADRAKALETAFKPIDKKYWENLKLLKEYSQQQGDLEKMEVVIAEINKLLAPYENQNKVSQKDKPITDKVEEISLTKLEPAEPPFSPMKSTQFRSSRPFRQKQIPSSNQHSFHEDKDGRLKANPQETYVVPDDPSRLPHDVYKATQYCVTCKCCD